MIKADIVKRVGEELEKLGPLPPERPVLGIVDEILESMKAVIAREGRLEIRDFGVFQVKTRKARIGRNPKNKRAYPIPSRRVVTFKSGKEIKDLRPSIGSGDE